MAYTITQAYKSGVIHSDSDAVNNNTLKVTPTAAADNPADADRSRTSTLKSNSPRILVITTGNAAGQFRKITGHGGSGTAADPYFYTLDYPWNISPFRGENYQDDDQTEVTEVEPASGDSYVLSSTMEDVYNMRLATNNENLSSDDTDVWDTTFDSDTMDNAATILPGKYYETVTYSDDSAKANQQINIGNNSNSVVVFDENVVVKADFRRFQWNVRTSDGTVIRGMVVFGYPDMGFRTIETYLTSTQVSVSNGNIVQDSDGNLYRNISGVTQTNVSTAYDSDDWEATDSSGDPIWLNLSRDNGFPRNGCKIVDTGYSATSSEKGDMHFYGCNIEFAPSGEDLSNEGPWTETSSNRTFWRGFRANGSTNVHDYGDNNINRFWGNLVYGPAGARLQGKQSIILDNKYIGGGQALGSFNPVSHSSGYFGLIKGNTFAGKTQGLYCYFQLGPNMVVDNPTFQNITTSLIFINNGTELSSNRLTLTNFDVTQLTEQKAFGDPSVTFINRKSGGNNAAKAEIEQDVTIKIRDEVLDNVEEAAKLAWRNQEGTEFTGTSIDADTSPSDFTTQRLLRWDHDITTGDNDLEDGTDYGPFDFIIVSYENNSVTFSNSLDNEVDLTYTVTEDANITEAYDDVDLSGSVATTSDCYHVAKKLKYDFPFRGGYNKKQIIDIVSDTLVFNDDTMDARTIEFDDTISDSQAVRVTDSLLEFKLASATSDIDVNVDLGSTNDINCNNHTMTGNTTCKEYINSFDDQDTIFNGGTHSGIIQLDGNATYFVDGGANVADVHFQKNGDAGTDPEVIFLDAAGLDDATFDSDVVPIIRATVTVTGFLAEDDFSEAAENTRAYSKDSSDTYTSQTVGTRSAYDGDDGKGFTFTIDYPNGEELIVATSFTQFKLGKGTTSGTSLNIPLTRYTATEFATHTLSDDENTFLDGSTIADESDSAVDNGIRVSVPVAGITIDEAGCRQIMWSYMSSGNWLNAIAQEYIEPDQVEFDSNGIVVSPTDHFDIRKSSSSSNIINFNIEVVDGAGDNAKGNVTSTDANFEVRLLDAATKVLVPQSQLTFVRTQMEEELDERDLTKTNVKNLGLFLPTEES